MNLKYWQFPIIPIVEYEQKTEHRLSQFHFAWLCFSFYTLNSFGFGIEIHCKLNDGIGITLELPFCQISVSFPFPTFIHNFIYKYLYRKL